MIPLKEFFHESFKILLLILVEPTKTSQTTESSNVTSTNTSEAASTGKGSGISVSVTVALETQDPGKTTTEIDNYTDDTTNRGILQFLRIKLLHSYPVISCYN